MHVIPLLSLPLLNLRILMPQVLCRKSIEFILCPKEKKRRRKPWYSLLEFRKIQIPKAIGMGKRSGQ
jgi:hypothetical protein